MKFPDVNWKIVGATIASALTILAALPYSLGDLATIIPSEWKPKIVAIGLIATVVLRLWNTNMTTPTSQPTDPATTNPKT